MLEGFKKFILRGNVVDLAIGVVIGSAFTGLVTTFTDSFITPLIRLITGGDEVSVGGTFAINGVDFYYGDFIAGVINFLIIAAVLYFFVVAPLNHLAERRKKEEVPSDEKSNEERMVELLEQIAAKR